MKVLVVDDNSSIRSMLRLIVEQRGGEVIGESANGREAVEVSKRLRPDVILLDISMPLMGGFSAARWFQESMPEIALVFVTQHRDRSYAEEAIDCGAKGYVVKDAAVTELPMALEALEAGQIYQSALVK